MFSKMVTPKLQGSGRTAPGTQKASAKVADSVLTFAQGDTIFSKGDVGGDLLFIESGKVEIFIQTEKETTILAQMGPGEIIGVMTFLTKDARLASARAVEPTAIKKISSQIVQKYIATFPKWLHIVLKEFVGRITEMNRMYAEASIALKKSRELQITPLFIATQMAQSLGVLARGLAKDAGETHVLVEEIQKNLQMVLNQPKDMIDGLIRVFSETGMITVSVDPVRKQKAFTIASLDKASIFTQFVRESTQGSTRKILKARFTSQEIALVKAIAQFSVQKGNAEDKSGVVKGVDLISNFETATGVKFEPTLLEKPAKLGLIVMGGEGENATITFTPATVTRTLACVEMMRRITSLNDGFEVVAEDETENATEQSAA